MNVEHSYWEETFLALRRMILEADTVDVLMRKALHLISTTYHAEGILWVGLEEATTPESCRAYATTQAWRAASNRLNRAFRSTGAALGSFSSNNHVEKDKTSNHSDSDQLQSITPSNISSSSTSLRTIRRFRPAALPLWLVHQRSKPILTQLESGDLILPITEAKGHSARITRGSDGIRPTSIAREVPDDLNPESDLARLPRSFNNQELRFVFQFWRRESVESSSSSPAQLTFFESRPQDLQDSDYAEPQSSESATAQMLLKTTLQVSELSGSNQTSVATEHSSDRPESFHKQGLLDAQPMPQNLKSIQGWSVDEILSLRASCNLLLLATDALSWKRRLEQAQQHTSLLSRTSHLLNSSFHPDVIVKKILAEVGQSIRCDRAILVDLRDQMAHILSLWERPRHSLKPVEAGAIDYSLWQDTVELLVNGGASYIEMTINPEDSEPLQRWIGNSGAGSALVLPIFIREDFLGTVVLLSHRRDRNYFLDELQIAGQGAEQLAIALAMIQTPRPTHTSRDSVPLHTVPSVQEKFQDELTGLPNLQALEQELQQLSAPSIWAFREPFSLVICDLDYFKLVNDTHGSDIGDRVLQRIAQCLQRQLRRHTPLYRYGGEEFVIFLENTELEKAKDVAERLRRSVHALNLRTASGILELTASFGVAQQQPRCDRSALDVLKRSEKALFEAKRLGRDRVEGISAADTELE